jgi:hypothetical protein
MIFIAQSFHEILALISFTKWAFFFFRKTVNEYESVLPSLNTIQESNALNQRQLMDSWTNLCHFRIQSLAWISAQTTFVFTYSNSGWLESPRAWLCDFILTHSSNKISFFILKPSTTGPIWQLNRTDLATQFKQSSVILIKTINTWTYLTTQSRSWIKANKIT